MAEYDFHFTAEVMDGIFGEVITARGAWDTLGERLDNIEQGAGGDTYTKAEVDTMLAEKVDKVTGKDLSTNDFTNADKAQITTNKNNISTDEAALIELVDGGAKNLLEITATSGTVSGVTYVVNNDKSITFNGTASDTISLDLPAPATVSGKTYFVSGSPAGGANSTTYRQLIRDVTNQQNLGSDIGNGVVITFPDPIGNVVVRINIFSGYTANNLTFKPMICTKAAWDISQEFVPYAPTNRELYEMILALQSGT